MDYKKEIKKYFEDSTLLTQSRYETSKDMFIGMSLVFFLNYFFVGAKFYDALFLKTLPFTYFFFVGTFGLFVFFYFKNNFDFKPISYIMLAIFLVMCGMVSLFPFSGISF